MKRYLYIFMALAAIACSKETPIDNPSQDPEPEVKPVVIKEYKVPVISEMTLRQKVCEMFFIRPESIETAYFGQALSSYKYSTTVSDGAKANYKNYPVGGIVLFAKNIVSPNQVLKYTEEIHELDGYPLICVDEEGGKVARLANNSSFGLDTYTDMYSFGETGSTTAANKAGVYIGKYLNEYGFDVDFAPVADVFTNPNNTVIGRRAFSSDPTMAAKLSTQFLLGLQSSKVTGCLKHFPGHGDTQTDSHYGYAETTKTWDEMLSCEMLPFKSGIENGAKLIMTAHIGTPNVTSDGMPASLSKVIITDKLRGELGFKGIVITDAIEMGAITSQFTVEEAALKAIQAGCDIVLMPSNLQSAVDEIVAAVNDGRITEERINESVEKILQLKRDTITSRGEKVAEN